MRLGRLLRGLFRGPGGLVLVAGAVGVLVGVEYWISSGTTRRARSATKSRRIPPPAPALRPVTVLRTDYFKIRQTRSEIGYVYWILQGFGKYRCFVLFDTWREAMDDASLRLAETTGAQSWLVFAAAGRG